jgi:hypothetical protein
MRIARVQNPPGQVQASFCQPHVGLVKFLDIFRGEGGHGQLAREFGAEEAVEDSKGEGRGKVGLDEAVAFLRQGAEQGGEVGAPVQRECEGNAEDLVGLRRWEEGDSMRPRCAEAAA